MPSKARVATTSFYWRTQPTVADKRDRQIALATVPGERADLGCLAETSLEVSFPREQLPIAEPLPGPRIDSPAALATRHEPWIVAPSAVVDARGVITHTHREPARSRA